MSPISVLIVEDEAIVAEDIAASLRGMGYDVAGLAVSGEQAIAIATQACPDLVLMDICLRGAIDGIEVAHQVRDRLQIPVLYLTAYADQSTWQRVKASQPFGYLLKPFQEEELQAAVEIALIRHRAEQEVQQTLARVRQSEQGLVSQHQRQAEYFSMAAHEFNHPISAIRLSTELLQNYGDQLPDTSKQVHLQRIQAAIDHLEELLTDMLSLGKSNTTPRFEPQPLNLVHFCQEQIDTLKRELAPYHTLTFVHQPTTLIAWVDQTLLVNILTPLLSNAIRYSPAGSEIILSLFCTTTDFCLQIQDQGCGIPADCQTCLFEPFHRARNVADVAGNGLGLALVKRAVELHQGRITYQSAVNQGTTFIVTLPLTGGSMPEPTAGSRSPQERS